MLHMEIIFLLTMGLLVQQARGWAHNKARQAVEEFIFVNLHWLSLIVPTPCQLHQLIVTRTHRSSVSDIMLAEDVVAGHNGDEAWNVNSRWPIALILDILVYGSATPDVISGP